MLTAATTEITLAANTPNVYAGQSVTLTALVTSASTPTDGTVTFTDGATTLGTATVVSGVATLNAVLPVGANSLAASYGGDGVNWYASSTTGLGPGSIIKTIAGNGTMAETGDGGLASAAEVYDPGKIAVDSSGDLFFIDAFARIREISASGYINTIAGGGTNFGAAMNGQAATQADLIGPNAVAVDTKGNLYIAEMGSVLQVNLSTDIINIIANSAGKSGITGDGGQAIDATFEDLLGIAVDAAGNVYVADYEGNNVREINMTTGIVTDVAGTGAPGFSGDGGLAINAELEGPHGVTVDDAGNVYIADTVNDRIREVIHVTGEITTVAGNGQFSAFHDGVAATTTMLSVPVDVAVDSHGDIFIDDQGNERIREVNAVTGIINTVAGNGNVTYGGDGGPAIAASFSVPGGIAMDSSGDIFVADTSNDRIREVVSNSQPTIVTVAASPVHAPTVTNSTTRENAQSTAGLVITPNPSDAGIVADFQITAISGGTLYLNNGVTQVTNGEFITLAQGEAGLRFTPTSGSLASGSFSVQSSTAAVAEGLGGSLATATITVAPISAPTSSVAVLPARTSLTSIPISWSGTVASGAAPITSYTIYDSVNGGAYSPWLTGTTLTSSTFTASVGNVYAFYSRATDSAGDVEAAHTKADASVTVTAYPWHNSSDPDDVLGNGGPVIPQDVLVLIQYLNAQGAGALPASAPIGSYYYDVKGNGVFGPTDALLVIQAINAGSNSPSIATSTPSGPSANVIATHSLAADSSTGAPTSTGVNLAAIATTAPLGATGAFAGPSTSPPAGTSSATTPRSLVAPSADSPATNSQELDNLFADPAWDWIDG